MINKYTADCETIMKNDTNLRLYALVREDLNMTVGKKISQAGHAYLGAFINSDPDTIKKYHKDFPSSPGTKVCLSCKNLRELLNAKEEADKAGIASFLVIDSGCTNFFNGEPTITALGLGPATKSQIKHITRRFQLM